MTQPEAITAAEVNLGDVVSLPPGHEWSGPTRVVGVGAVDDMRIFYVEDTDTGQMSSTRHWLRFDRPMIRYSRGETEEA